MLRDSHDELGRAVSSRDRENFAPSPDRARAVGLLAPALLLLFLLLAGLFWRTQAQRKTALDPCRPLVRFVEQGDVFQAELLLKQGCSANYQRPGVLSSPSDQNARLRLQSRSDRNRFSGTPLLEIAAQNNDIAVLSLLLARGAKVDGRGVYGYTALIRAASRANVEVVSLLLHDKANPNLRDMLFGETALHKATRSTSRRLPEPGNVTARRQKIVRLLLQGGANQNITDSRGRKALTGFSLSPP